MAKNIFYNAHHSPVGAFASFTLGFKGASGGLGMELAGPACQNVFIGAETDAPGRFKALPFYDGHRQADDRPDGPQDHDKDPVITAFGDDEITREITPATDVWRAGDLEFKIYTPHLPIPDPERKGGKEKIKQAVIPAVFVELTLDNTGCPRPRKAFFGYEGNDPYSAMRRYDGDAADNARRGDHCLAARKTSWSPVVGNKIKGIGQGRITGIFTDGADAECALAFSAHELLAGGIADRLPFGLGTTGLLLVTAGANELRTWRFAVCFYRGGLVTSGGPPGDLPYLYTYLFPEITWVAAYGLKNFDFYRQAATDYDRMIFQPRGDKPCSPALINDDRRFMLSMAIKSYYGSTQLLASEDYDDPIWVVNEGAYRMMNTLDLAVDHLFFEMRANPWVVRNVLERYVGDYCYVDRVKNAAGEEFEGGISFTHDMGVMNVFSPGSRSAYELRGLTGCYSYMTQEQLVNWILCAGVYWSGGCRAGVNPAPTDGVGARDKTGDACIGAALAAARDDAWIRDHRRIIEECLTSMVNRDGVDHASRDGVMDLDSCKTGGGAEITTYDNVDKALGQARRSSYLAVKCWAAYLALEKMFGALKLSKQAQTAASQAQKCAATILKYRRADGTIPALLEDGNEAMTLSIVEGLVYPHVMGMFGDPKFINTYGDFVDALKAHFVAALKSGCKFDDGSWKMTRTSDNSWLSKTFLCQFIAERIFGIDADGRADKIHASWLLDPDNAFYAFSDQIIAGKAQGSKYYPRGVTGILWV